VRICPVCRREEIPSLVQCPDHLKNWVNETDLPVPLTDGDVDRIAERVVKILKHDEDLDRVALKVRSTFTKEDWKILANQVLKSLHIVHDVDVISKALLGLWRFWLILGISLVAIYFLLREVVGEAAKEEARTQFNKEVAKQISAQFENERISNIVVWAASSQASSLMSNAVTPQIDKFNYTLNIWTTNLESKLHSIEQKETNLDSRLNQLKETTDSVQKSLHGLQRSIPSDRKDEVIAKLTVLPKGCKIRITSAGTMSEATIFSQELLDLFRKCGFDTTLSVEPNGGIPQPLGERMHVNNLTNAPPCAGPIQQLFNSVGFQFTGEIDTSLSNEVVHLIIWNKSPY
jgi:hypothetical protein